MLDILNGVYTGALTFFDFIKNIPSMLSNVLVGIPEPLILVLTLVLSVLIVYRIISIIL